MIIDHDESMLVVLLEDMVQHSIPRVLSIRKNMKQGEVLSNSDLEFFNQLVNRIIQCNLRYGDDKECQVIFSTISHLVYKVIHRAYKNEQIDFNTAAYATT
jgi:uncharacterized protein (UPF0305 family)